VVVLGRGLGGLSSPEVPIACGRDVDSAFVLAGALAGGGVSATLILELETSFIELADALVRRGARVRPGAAGALQFDAVERLLPFETALDAHAAGMKSALLLSGLYASGPTTLHERAVSADHTERLLDTLNMPVETMAGVTRLHPPADPNAIAPFEVELVGDISCAAVLFAAAQLVPGSAIGVRRCGVNPTRTGVLDALRVMGASPLLEPRGAALGEPFAELSHVNAGLRGRALGGEIVWRAAGDLAALCALAVRAAGTTELHDLPSCPRLGRLVQTLRSFDVPLSRANSSLTIEGQPDRPLRACRIAAGGDPAVVVLGVLLGLAADGETIVDGAECIASSFPRFAGTLRALGAEVEVES
jgi:3-phosphoshikimate 1-carboxyvinyltransferase